MGSSCDGIYSHHQSLFEPAVALVRIILPTYVEEFCLLIFYIPQIQKYDGVRC